MRIHFKSTKRPLAIAKRLRRELRAAQVDVSLGRAQAVTAELYGYADWHELDQLAGMEVESLDDDKAGPEVALQRLNHQILVLAKLVDRNRAKEILLKIRPAQASYNQPINTKSETTRTWAPFANGEVTHAGRSCYMVQPFGSGFDISCCHAQDLELLKPHHFNRADWAETPAAAKAKIEQMIEDERPRSTTEPTPTERRKVEAQDLDFQETPWEEIDYATIYAPGLVQLVCAAHGGFRVSKELVEQMPEVLRVRIEDDGFGWYEEDEKWSLVFLGLPQFFTAREQRQARRMVSETFPKALDYLDGRTSGPDALKRAKRFISEERFDWAASLRGPTRPDGLVPVHTHINGYWGWRDLSDDDFRRLWTFLVPEKDLASEDFEIDPERYQEIKVLGSETDILKNCTPIVTKSEREMFGDFFDMEP
jgi:hypothetical protein